MRTAISVTIALLLASPALAEHGDPVLIPAPTPGTVIPRNARIRLESHNGIAYMAEALARGERGHEAVLVAADHEIALRVESFFDDQEGGYGAGLLVLAPRCTLAAGTEYRLELRWPGPDGNIERWAEWTWTTSDKVDRDPPIWLSTPRRGRSDTTVMADVGPESPLVEIIADLVPPGRGTRKRLHLVLDTSRACDVGPTTNYATAIASSSCAELGPEGLCQTAHLFQTGRDVGRRFRVRLTAIDLAGNRGRASGPLPVITWDQDLALTVCLPVGGS